MLTRLISTIRPFTTTTTSFRLFNTSAPRLLSDGNHTRSTAAEKATDDLKTRKEKRWLDTVASDSEAIVKGEKQFDKKQGDGKKDMNKLQEDTIEAIHDKEAKGHLQNHDVGRKDTHEERMGSGGSLKKPKKR